MESLLPSGLIALVFLFAGLVKGVSGMGLPTLAMALLGLWMPPASAAVLMSLPSLLTNITQCIGPHARMLARRLWPMWAGLVLVTVWLPLPDMAASSGFARAGLGAVLLLYGGWGLARPALPAPGRHASALGALAGMLAGLLTAATGVFVMPLVPYLQSLRLQREALIQALGLSFALATLALVVRLGRVAGTGLAAEPLACAIATLSAFAGLWLGTVLRRRMDARRFQRALYAAFLLLGLLLLSQAL